MRVSAKGRRGGESEVKGEGGRRYGRGEVRVRVKGERGR